jgi:hypothetical protein
VFIEVFARRFTGFGIQFHSRHTLASEQMHTWAIKQHVDAKNKISIKIKR